MKASNFIADISDAQESFDAKAYKNSGRTRIRIKATQGSAFVAKTYFERVDAAHSAGLAVDHYHYLDSSPNGDEQAAHFLATVAAHIKAGDRFMVDVEAEGVNGALTSEFIARCASVRPNVQGLIYVGPYFARSNHVVSTHNWGIVLADYPEPFQLGKSVPAFWPDGFPAAPREWQYTDDKHMDGFNSGVDDSYIVKPLTVVKVDPHAPTDLTAAQARVTRRFTKHMHARRHPMTKAATELVETALVAGTHAKDIKA